MSDSPIDSPTDTATVQTPSPDGAVEPSPLDSVLAGIKADRLKLGAGSDPLDLVVPGYHGALVLRCQWIPFAKLTAGAKALADISEPTEQMIVASADTLVTTCKEFLIKVDGVLKPLSTTAEPITFGDPRLAEALGFPAPATARAGAEAVFRNDYAMIRTGNAIVAWLQDTTKTLDEEFLGN